MFKCDVCTFCGVCVTVLLLQSCVMCVKDSNETVTLCLSASQCGRQSIVLGVGSVCSASNLLCWYQCSVWGLVCWYSVQACVWSCVDLLGHMVFSILCLDCVFILRASVCVSDLVKKLGVWCVDMVCCAWIVCLHSVQVCGWACVRAHSYLLLWSKWLVRAKIWQS
jgi:hypothetical protein